jgi:hypothetical protein
MNRRSQNALTLKGLLELTAQSNAGQLMHRAHTANRLAKSVSGRARRAAYRVKTDALVTLKKRFHDQVELLSDDRQPRMVVVAVAAAHFGLHVPTLEFAKGEGLR